MDVSEAYFARFPQLRDELHDLNVMSDHGFISREDYIKSVAKITGQSEAETVKGFASEHVINQELIDYIHQLRAQYKVGLLSNIGRNWIQDFFDEHQLHDLFDAVVLSSEEGITKPNPMIFERVAERLGLYPEECVMIDDREENCKSAEQVGMKSVLYTTTPELLPALEAVLKETK